jgi:hypothetical protein
VRDAASITTTDNGPNLVEGSLALLDAEGNNYEVDDWGFDDPSLEGPRWRLNP